MRRMMAALSLVLCLGPACGDDETEADRLGVGAACTSDEDCLHDGDVELTCLKQFKGGYCGLLDCAANEDCPDTSSCVAHTDGENYCFRDCAEKTQCNANRGADEEANCSSNVDYVEEATVGKSCVPPSG